MRLAFISTILYYPWGGADTLWTHAAEAAAARGDALFISVSPAVAASPRIAALQRAGARLLRREPETARSFTSHLLRKLRLSGAPDAALISALRRFRPDVVIFSQGGTYDVSLHPHLLTWLREQGVKYRIICNWQRERPQLEPNEIAFTREIFPGSDSLNFVSTRNLTVTREHLGLPLPNARVIQNPLRWQPGDTSPWPATATARLATVSRLDEGKGIHVLLQALAALPSNAPEWELNVYGEGPSAPQLRELAARSALRERVHLRGYVKGLRSIWAENHLMISPALEDGVPMTIPEAMLCERPVLATRVGGAEDWLRDGETGFLCAPADPDALAAALQRALAHRERWPAMGLAAQSAAKARYRADDYRLLIA